MRESYKAWIEAILQERNRTRAEVDEMPEGRRKDFFKRFYGDDDMVYMPKPVFKSIGCDGTFNLSMLIHHQLNKHPDAEEKCGGWFPCTIEDLQESITMSPGRQTRMLAKLEEKGYIKRRVLGKPPTRFVWIDFDRIVEEHIKNLKSRKAAVHVA